MATNNQLGNSFINKILPTFGQKRVDIPIWNESQHMFITDQYTSAAGNTYYLGVRISDQFVTILHIGLYHSWTYINEVEVYCFDGDQKKLIGKTKLDVFYDEDLVRDTTEKLLKDYMSSQMKLQGVAYNDTQLNDEAKKLVDRSYLSMFDSNTTIKLEAVRPLLAQHNN
ncbi:MAG: hypothetical protein MJZ74_00825 [Muribaculaceae bacterium]|nr:hypothetical protein [Muribaculaceae bacterium]